MSNVIQLEDVISTYPVGHVARLQACFLDAGVENLADYELLELLLFRADPQRDLRRLAHTLIERFGSFAEVLAAPPQLLREIQGISDRVVTEFKIAEASVVHFTRSIVRKKDVLGSFSAVIDYCRAAMAFAPREEFRLLFLDKKNGLIADEVQAIGTVDHTPVYLREVVKRALELSASGIIMVHNHPSGDPAPSEADIRITNEVIGVAVPLGIVVHDHIIIGRHGHASLRRLKMI